MKRSYLVVLLALIASAAVFVGSYQIAQHFCARQVARTDDDLLWLKQEFRLTGAEMTRIRTLHNGYLPQCGEMCERIAAKKRELEQALTGETNFTAVAEQKLSELAALRARCQAQMLRHFVEVSRAMPPEQGQRYLAEMQRLTLGFHEQIEQSMSDSAGHAHGHH
jgi:hypothetical protein